MADISKVTLPNNETYDLKDSVARGGIGNAKLFYGTCSSAAAATEKAVTCSEFTANDLVAGTMINVKFDATNSGAVGSLTLNVNGTGAKSIKYIYNNERNNIPAAGYLLKDNMYTFRYDGTYWVAQLMYNTNTTTSYGYYDYYFRACAGTSAIYRYKIVGMGEDNRLYPIVTTNQTSATQVAKEVQTIGIRPGHLWIYYSTTTASAGGAIAAATLLAGGGANTVGAYSFNESIPTYRTIYLRGTYDREKDLFYLYDDGTTPCKSYYTFVPTNSAVTLSDYFVEGNYYMIVGGSYSSENYFSIFADNPLYYFDGTNLIPVSTKVAKDEITSMVGTDEQENNAPYSFRKTANGRISGSTVAAYDEIVGGSIVWNQLVQNGDFATVSNWSAINGTYTVSGNVATFTSTAADNVTKQFYQNVNTGIDHKHLIVADVNPSKETYVCLRFGSVSGSPYLSTAPANTWSTVAGIKSAVTSRTEINVYGLYRLEVGDTVKIRNVMVIDLTAAVTPLIADYIYSLEQTTAGAGVAWFKKYFPGVYYGFTEPHFEHVQTSGKTTVGFNQWDEVWENGGIDANGNNVAASGRLRSKNHIPAFPETVYYMHVDSSIYPQSWYGLFFYDENKQFISTIPPNVNRTFTTPTGTRYIRFYLNDGWGGKAYTSGICINLHGDRDGEYEPYRKRTYPIEPKVLRGVLKLDSANRLYFDGDIYKYDGSVSRRYIEQTYNGSENWLLYTYQDKVSFRVAATDIKSISENIITNKGFVYSRFAWAGTTSKLVTPYDGWLYFYDPNITTLADWKASLQVNPITVVCELTTHVNEIAEPYQYPMVCDSYGTEEFIDYGVEQGTRDIAIPVGHNTKYRSGIYGEIGFKADTSYVEELVSNIDNSIPDWAKAPTKPTYTASEVGLGNVGNFKAVSTVASQGLTSTEQANARANIGAGTSSLAIGTTSSTAAAGNHTHGNITNGGDITSASVTVANKDAIVINDDSASKLVNGPVFDGSTTTKALTPKGTWETFLQSHQSLDGYVPTSRTINSKALTGNITLAASDVGAAKAESVATATLAVASWSNGVYSFTSTYPNASYDIAVEPDGNSITTAQYEAWTNAKIVGNSASNTIKALGTVPTVAIPVLIRVMPK